MDYWHQKACLITGGSAGLGRVLAETLARRGARVMINGRDRARLADTAAALQATGGDVCSLAGDVTDQHFVRQMVGEAVETFARLDLVCHAAGRSMRGELATTNRHDFEALWKVNSRAAFDVASAAADPLTASRGHLVLIGSLACRLAPRFLGGYSASKFPLAAMAQQLRLERGPAGLHTLLVMPGPIARTDSPEVDRYQAVEQGLPESADKPGGGAKVEALDPERLSADVLKACQRRQAELVRPRRARLLFVLNQLSPPLGDWLLRKMSG